ncbi:ABC transporter permease [Streptomyces albofaciens JCM 4342]|uniref:ABC transporter permease n=1 Tax=Streptomyces albofaciens TaxID=66866 RepID=UPI00123A4832|nr:ABC transporter permease [Streptomyces albofaciens]KAA6222753.1 ABC transporter permease [Streptomyces albofaciens JCM 4342]
MATADDGTRGIRDQDPHSGSFLGEVKDAVSARAALLMIGVLALTALFIASYAGAFHSPKPKDVALAVVAPQQLSGQLVERLDKLPGSPLDPRAASSEADATRQLKERDIDGALIVDPRGSTDKLLVAGGSGASLSQAVEQVVTQAEKAQKRTVRVQDIAPADKDDTRGLSSFYLVVGWCVGGYLCAAILAISFGARPTNPRRAVIRLGALAVYSVLTGLAGAVVIGPILGALPGSLYGLWGLGALIVFAVGATTFAFQAIAGIIGIGLTILVVVIAGNPSAGGAYPYPLLPDFWRAIGPALPPGAGTWASRSIAYFHGNAVTGPLLVLSAWAVAGTVLTLVFAALTKGRTAINRSEVRQ